ncbi:myc box-dependent-interacting protein 1-like [Oppia nitens]|uniref:myc box-dependent-interacting protein 1-like n=1 Tax=Oppia nitens TaxID=1686743 RepID=UPI0023D98ECB|nr:myc box-dependent-interacting protein 1-like [Oppia nitens]
MRNQNMAESKASGFSRVVQKHSLRAKERLLQNFGKADKTTDELFEVYQNNFNKQQNTANRLQKELKNYYNCCREMQMASKSLMDCIEEIYEQEWPGHDQIHLKAQTLELLWGDLCHKINDQCTIPLSTYLSQFSEIRNKISKRGRKLVDYDGCRHSVEAVETASKKRDDIKVAKAREQMEEARRLYEVLNKELHEELPALYDSRIPFLVSNLQTLFSAENTFHSEYSKVSTQFCDLIDVLAAEASKGSFISNGRHTISSSPKAANKVDPNGTKPYEEIDFKPANRDIKCNQESQRISVTNGLSTPSKTVDTVWVDNTCNDTKESLNKLDNTVLNESTHIPDCHKPDIKHELNEKSKAEELYDIPIGATTTDLPPGVLYKVRATFKYAAEDSDELSFEMSEIIHVVDYEDPEEQEEGWLMGIRELNGDKGLFPANFTRPI